MTTEAATVAVDFCFHCERPTPTLAADGKSPADPHKQQRRSDEQESAY
jgi:hypothetical protein